MMGTLRGCEIIKMDGPLVQMTSDVNSGDVFTSIAEAGATLSAGTKLHLRHPWDTTTHWNDSN